jgi:hypothetical protein
LTANTTPSIAAPVRTPTRALASSFFFSFPFIFLLTSHMPAVIRMSAVRSTNTSSIGIALICSTGIVFIWDVFFQSSRVGFAGVVENLCVNTHLHRDFRSE